MLPKNMQIMMVLFFIEENFQCENLSNLICGSGSGGDVSGGGFDAFCGGSYHHTPIFNATATTTTTFTTTRPQ